LSPFYDFDEENKELLNEKIKPQDRLKFSPIPESKMLKLPSPLALDLRLQN